jgi:hypothetical protein
MSSIKHTRGVLDLTFMDIDSEETLAERIRTESALQIKSPSKKSGNTAVLAGEVQAGGKSKGAEAEKVRAVRLSNNRVKTLDTLVGPMVANIDTKEIQWLDLSFNHIQSFGHADNVSAAFQNITTIYMHANKVSRLSQVKKLKAFPNLKSLTLYGNPIEEHKHYRNYVMYYCPHISQFDSSPITHSERVANEVWAKNFRNLLSKEDDE